MSLPSASPTPEYGFDARIPHTDAYLSGPVLAELARLGARRVLDLGCGNGALAARLHAAGHDVAGMDPSASGIDHARRICPSATFHRLGVYDDPAALGDVSFDAVVSTEVVEHLYNPRALPRFARSVLRPGGALVITTPYHGYLKNLVLGLAGKWDAHFTALWDGGHIKFWSRRTLGRLLEEEGFTVTRFVGCGRWPWMWKSMLLTAVRR